MLSFAGSLFVAALFAAGGQAGIPPHEYLPDPLLDSVDYTSDAVAGHAHQRFALFRPHGTPPVTGTPVLIVVHNSGLQSSESCYASPILPDKQWIYSFLDAGFAVVNAVLTSSNTSNAQSACVPYPDLSSQGNGLFHPPGVALPGLAVPPYSDPKKPMAEKDVVMLVQHVRHNAAAYGLDPDRIAITGRSGGAIIAMWAAVGPERGPELFPNGTGQDAESSRVDAGVFISAPLYLPAFVLPKFDVPHFCTIGSGPKWTTPAKTLATAIDLYLLRASPLRFESDAHSLNEGQRFYFAYREAAQSTKFHPPYIANKISAPHSSWFGYAWKTLHPQSRLVIYGQKGLVVGGPHDALIVDKGRLALDMVRYLREEMNIKASVEHVYDDGMAAKVAAGERLTPFLTGSGEFTSTGAPLLSLEYARPSAKAVLAFSTDYVGLSWLGGTLGPDPSNGPVPLKTDALGMLKLQVPANTIPPGVSVLVQVWVQDPSGPTGFTASNTIRLDG